MKVSIPRPTRVCAGLLAAFGGVALSGGALLVATPAAHAQAAERIEITGSLIRRIEGESALPVITLKLDELERAGVTNAEQVVRFITQNQGGSVTSGSVSGTNGAASYASLRNLGEGRTLVLLNGKRVVSNPFATSAVDLNTIPMSAIDRIETLTDGASATYGTDAIAGVINFITKREYRGVTLSAQAQTPSGGGGEVYSANLLAGIGDLGKQGWNLYGGFNVREGKPMGGTQREFSRRAYLPDLGYNALSPTTFPANYSQTVPAPTAANPNATRNAVVNANPSLPGCLPPSSILAAPVATNRCNADTQVFTNTIPEQEQNSLFAKGSLALGSHMATLEYFKSYNRVTTTIAPSPEGGLTMGPDSPFFPGNGINPITDAGLDRTQPISISWRTTALNSRSGEQENNTQRLVAGLEGTLASWDYQASLQWTNAKVENFFLNGYPTTVAMRNGVRGINGAPFLNPFGDQSAAGLAFLQSNTVLGKVQDGEATVQTGAFTATRSLGKMAGGTASMALATEFRTEEMVYNTDIPKVSQASTSGLAGSGAVRQGDRDVTALALELSLPVLKGLEIGASLRYDKYSDFGNTTNPKFSLRYNVTDSLLLRGSYNKGFSAPSLYNLYLPNSTTFTGNRYNDPVLCPGGVASAAGVPSRDCGIQFQQLQGGNADLRPEKSTAWTVGFVMQATRSFAFGLDYWDYTIKSSVSQLGDATIFADPTKYASLYVRCSQAPAARRTAIGACQIPGGDPLAYVINTNANLGDVETSGVDLQFNWNSGATANGRFTVGVRGSYVTKYRFQTEPGGAFFNPVGRWESRFISSGTSGGPVLRYQQVATFGWERKDWSSQITHRFQRGYRDQNSQGAPFTSFNTRTVADHEVFDVAFSYTGMKNLTLGLGVLNLLNSDPPFSNQTARFQARAYDDRYVNPLGRTWQVSGKYSF